MPKRKRKSGKRVGHNTVATICHHSNVQRLVRLGEAITEDGTNWLELFRAGADHCSRCRATSGLTVHHKLPKSRGGQDRPNNLDILCRSCHDTWHSLENLGVSYRRFLQTKPGALEKLVKKWKADNLI